jgi:hypothetical protein
MTWQTRETDAVWRLGSYLRLLFSSFFNWWWAAITGFASIASFLAVPEDGVTFGRLAFGLSLMGSLTLLFLTLTTVYQGWTLFQKAFPEPHCVGVHRSDEYDTNYVFLLEDRFPLPLGMLVELHRYCNGVDCLAGVLEVIERNAKQQYQAKPVWISPGHKKDLRTGLFNVADIMIYPLMSSRAFERLALPQAESDEGGLL